MNQRKQRVQRFIFFFFARVAVPYVTTTSTTITFEKSLPCIFDTTTHHHTFAKTITSEIIGCHQHTIHLSRIVILEGQRRTQIIRPTNQP